MTKKENLVKFLEDLFGQGEIRNINSARGVDDPENISLRFFFANGKHIDFFSKESMESIQEHKKESK